MTCPQRRGTHSQEDGEHCDNDNRQRSDEEILEDCTGGSALALTCYTQETDRCATGRQSDIFCEYTYEAFGIRNSWNV